jgi:carbamoyl-phosphate synthase large subunit
VISFETEYSCIAVTGLHRGENPQSGSATIRSIRRIYPSIKIVGLCYDPMESGIYSKEYDYADETYLLPLPYKGHDVLYDRLRDILLISKFDLVIPCLDSEIENFINIKNRLRDVGVSVILPTKISHNLRSKLNLPNFCKVNGISIPDTQIVNNINEAYSFAENYGYPIYVKGRFYEAHLAYSFQQIEEYFQKIRSVWGLPIIVQQCLLGEEYNVIGLGDGKGSISEYCQIRKLLRTSTGKGFAGVVILDPILKKLSEKIINKLSWKGPFELEFIKPSHASYYLLEINPRFPAWVDFPSQLGCNLPAKLIAMFEGKKEELSQHCKPGNIFVRHCIDIAGDMSEFADLCIDGVKTSNPNSLSSKISQ